jgi:HK97 family phage portal protein
MADRSILATAYNATFGAIGRQWARQTKAAEPGAGTWMMPTGARIPGVRLTHWSQALSIPAVYRATNLISQSVAMLPWNVFKRGDDGQAEAQPKNPVQWLLHDEPNADMTAFSFKRTLLTHALLQGNGYAEIERNKRGQPIAMHLIDDPDRVTPGLLANGRIAYKVQNAGADAVVLGANDVFHVQGLGTDGIMGLGLREVALRSLLVNMAYDEVAKQYFMQGMRTPGFIKTKGKMNPESFKSVMKLIKEEYTGLNNFELPIPLDGDMEFQAAGSTLHDADFLDLRKFSVIEICRWMGVPPHLVYDLEKATFSNIESQDRTFLTYGLLPHIVPMEQEANRKLLTSGFGGLYSKMNVNAFARGDLQARGAFYQQMRNMGVFTVNDILRLEEMNTIGADGDVRVMQVQYQPTDKKPGAEPPADDDDDNTAPNAPPPKPADRLLNGVRP